MTERDCDYCGNAYEAARPNSRFCSALCRKRNQRDPAAAKIKTVSSSLPPATPPVDMTLADVVKRDLELGDRLDTLPGQLALALAVRIGSPGTTASSVATLSKELRALVAEALVGTKPPVGDRLDEFSQRLAQKAASA